MDMEKQIVISGVARISQDKVQLQAAVSTMVSFEFLESKAFISQANNSQSLRQVEELVYSKRVAVTAVLMKTQNFWDITSCQLAKHY